MTVEGKDGALVPNLSPRDFVVRDDGVARPIATFARAADQVQAAPLDLHAVLLLDVSGSMEANVRLSREAAVSFLDSVPRAQELFVGLFDKRVRLRRYSPAARDTMLAWLNENEPTGGTALYDSVAATMDAFGQSSGQQIVVLLTDGVDEDSQMGLQDLTKKLEAGVVTVYCVAFKPGHPPPYALRNPIVREGTSQYYRQVDRDAEDALRSIARVTGGALLHASSAAELDSIYSRILAELGSRYAIGFSPTGARPGRFHSLEVEVRQKGLRVRNRAGYVAAAPSTGGP